MKLSVSKEGSEKLDKLMSKIQTVNPFAQKSLSALAEAIVYEFAETALETQVEAVAKRLTTNKGKQKSLVKTLRNITDHADEETLRALEKALKKLSQSAVKTTQNSA